MITMATMAMRKRVTSVHSALYPTVRRASLALCSIRSTPISWSHTFNTTDEECDACIANDPAYLSHVAAVGARKGATFGNGFQYQRALLKDAVTSWIKRRMTVSSGGGDGRVNTDRSVRVQPRCRTMPETGSWDPPVESSFSNPILPEVFMNHSSHIYRFLV